MYIWQQRQQASGLHSLSVSSDPCITSWGDVSSGPACWCVWPLQKLWHIYHLFDHRLFPEQTGTVLTHCPVRRKVVSLCVLKESQALGLARHVPTHKSQDVSSLDWLLCAHLWAKHKLESFVNLFWKETGLGVRRLSSAHDTVDSERHAADCTVGMCINSSDVPSFVMTASTCLQHSNGSCRIYLKYQRNRMGSVFSNVLYPHACLKGVAPPVRKSFRAWWKGAKPILTLKISSSLTPVMWVRFFINFTVKCIISKSQVKGNTFGVRFEYSLCANWFEKELKGPTECHSFLFRNQGCFKIRSGGRGNFAIWLLWEEFLPSPQDSIGRWGRSTGASLAGMPYDHLAVPPQNASPEPSVPSAPPPLWLGSQTLSASSIL